MSSLIPCFLVRQSDQWSQRRPKEIAAFVNFSTPPSLVITQVKKSPKITSSSTSPYSYNISFSPSSLHLRPDFSLLPTFLDHFSLLPIVYLLPLSTCRVGYHTSKLTSKPKCGLLLKTSIVWYRCVFNNYSSSPNGL